MANSLRASGKYFELTNSYASSGTRIHWYLAQSNSRQFETIEDEKELTTDELITARACQNLQDQIIKEWNSPDVGAQFIVEKRIWYRNGLVPRFSGQPDLAVINGKRALILNYKTGRLEAEPAADNLQLRAEIVLLKHVRPELEEIDGAIVEPYVNWDPERVSYKSDALAQAEAEILAIVDEAAWNDKRTAGPHCRYCPARVNCNEALDYVQTIPNPSVSKLFELPRGEAGSRLWEKIGLAQKLLSDLRETYKQILKIEPNALPGYVLPELGHRRRTVVDPAKFKAVLSEFLPAEKIDSLADYPICKIEEAYGQAAGITGKKLFLEFERLTARSVAVTNDEAFIRPLTKKEREANQLAKSEN